MIDFPIDSLKEKIFSALDAVDFLILKSTPGSGKTTRVPLFLTEKYHKKIYVLEPRKLAAKLASQYVAQGLGEQPGKRVGHIFKYERCATDETQVLFLTEGTFLRLLNSDPELKQCDVVILDEFHERHYQTDVALSFLLKIKEKNPDLKIIIMSATINLNELELLLKDRVKTVELNERRFDLEIAHLPNDTLVLKESLEKKVYNAFLEVKDLPGHILIFLPGMYEIKKCEEILSQFQHEIIILHGEVSGVSIDDSFYDLKRKRVILSTNIAESSVTIPGVRTVIDSGLHRTGRLNPITRLPLIELKKTSQSSCIQRANRASREANGKAVRLFAEMDYQSRPQFDLPEINRTDLSELILNAAELFSEDIEQFTFLSRLDANEIKKSKDYLEKIGLISSHQLTEAAHAIAKFPFHPRIAKILFEAAKGSLESFSATVKYLSEMLEPKRPDRFRSLAIKYFKAKSSAGEIETEKSILSGYVDQISKIKGHNQLVHMNGEVYTISPRILDQINPHHSLWIILDLDNKNHVTRILPIEEEWLYDLPCFPIEEQETIEFDAVNFKLKGERISRIGAIILSKEKLQNPTLNPSTEEIIFKKLLPVFNEKLECDQFRRLMVMEKYVGKKVTQFESAQWLKGQIAYFLAGNYDWEQAIPAYVNEVFDFLNSEKVYSLEKDLPLFLDLHDKRKVPLHYDQTNGVYSQALIQDFYGLENVPDILKGKEKIKIHLLGPHKRPLQVTQNLKSFWDKTYKELVGELKREYPRHYWPENPQTAKPVLLIRMLNSK